MDKTTKLNPKLLSLIAEGTSDGVGVAVGLWVQHNRVVVKPTDKSKNPIDDFCLMLMAEYQKDKVGYPFGERSIKSELDSVVSEHLLAIELLFTEDTYKEVVKLVRYLVCGQTLEFLESQKDKVVEIFDRIRKEGAPELDAVSHGPE